MRRSLTTLIGRCRNLKPFSPVERRYRNSRAMRRLLYGAGIALVLALAVFAALGVAKRVQERANDKQRTSNLAAAIENATVFSEKAAALADLIGAVGGMKAQAAIAASGIPFDIDTHMLTHEIGHALYRTSGIAAISRCSDYFHLGCYHGVIHSAMTEHGAAAIGEIRSACATLGEHMVGRCGHGIGHTLLVLHGYDLPATLAACDAVEAEFSVEAASCYSGAFMENGLGISEDAKINERWIRLDNPSFPCTDPGIPEGARPSCWEKQSFILDQVFTGDLARIAAGCVTLPPEAYRRGCYRTFAGWFLYPRTRGNTEAVFTLCREASPNGWHTECLSDVAAEAFESGDPTRIPFAVCARSSAADQESC